MKGTILITDCDMGRPDLERAVLTSAGYDLVPAECRTEDDVIAACRASLAGYKKPKRVVFVDELPRNASGKILKRELRERYRAGAVPTA